MFSSGMKEANTQMHSKPPGSADVCRDLVKKQYGVDVEMWLLTEWKLSGNRVVLTILRSAAATQYIRGGRVGFIGKDKD